MGKVQFEGEREREEKINRARLLFIHDMVNRKPREMWRVFSLVVGLKMPRLCIISVDLLHSVWIGRIRMLFVNTIRVFFKISLQVPWSWFELQQTANPNKSFSERNSETTVKFLTYWETVGDEYTHFCLHLFSSHFYLNLFSTHFFFQRFHFHSFYFHRFYSNIFFPCSPIFY